MKYVLAAMTIALLAGATGRAATSGVGALGRLEGTWQSSAAFVDSPYSKAGATSGTTVCAWSDGRDFLICQQDVVTSGVTTHDVAVYTYDPQAARYRFYAARTNGVSDVAIAVDDGSITYTNSFADGGKNVTIRTLNVWDDPDHYRFWTEYTTDGSHWTKMLTGSAHRVKAQP
jgi:hypothetical protein